MKNILDDIKAIKKLDSQNMLGSLEAIGKQVEQIREENVGFKLPENYNQTENIAVLGMGGSTLGAHIIKCARRDEISLPLEIVNDYNLPKWVGAKTLAIASSYSGNTEEVLVMAEKARLTRAKLVVIASGGKLSDWAKDNKIPALIFPPKYNPCGSPRIGLGYSIAGLLVILDRAGVLKATDEGLKQMSAALDKYAKKFSVETKDNPAKLLAKQLGDKSVWFVASEHLAGNAHAAANQVNENAKRFAGYFLIPELNHHLLEGLSTPASNPKNLAFVFFESNLYEKRIQQRYALTKKILEKNKINYFSYVCQEKDALGQVREVLALSGFLSFYLAMAAGIDPTAIPVVDFLKKEMKK